MMGTQTKRDLREASELLREMAADGDESAEAALAAPGADERRLRYDVVLEALEAMGEDEKERDKTR